MNSEPSFQHTPPPRRDPSATTSPPELRLGVFIPEFPGMTHIFFWREIDALRGFGCRVQIFSTKRPAVGSCSHHFAKGDHGAVSCWPPSVPRVLSTLIRRPRGSLRSLRYALEIKSSGSLPRRLGLWMAALDHAASLRHCRTTHVHVHTCADGAHVVAMASRCADVSYSLYLHGGLEVYGSDHAHKFKRAAFILAASRRHLQEAIDRGIARASTSLPLPMGVDLAAVVDRRPRPLGPLRVITVARLNRAKGHRFALQAIRRCVDRGVDLRYSIVGSGDHSDDIAREIRELRLESVVEMLGPRDAAEVARILADHDVFLLSSVGMGEAAPVAVMEAMASGLAIVCSRIGDTEDMVRHDVDGLIIDQADVNGIAAALEALANDRPRLDRMGASARDRAGRIFDSRKQATQLLERVLQVVNSRRPDPDRPARASA